MFSGDGSQSGGEGSNFQLVTNWVSGHFQAEITHCYYTMLSCNNPSWPESSSQWICERKSMSDLLLFSLYPIGWATSSLGSFALSSLVACGCISVVGVAMLSLWWSGCQGCQRGCMSARVCVDVWDVRGVACQPEFVWRSVCNKWCREGNKLCDLWVWLSIECILLCKFPFHTPCSSFGQLCN